MIKFIFYCSAFVRLKLKYLSRQTFGEPYEVAGININCLNKFAVSSKLFVDLWGSSDPLLEVYV